MSLEWMLHPFTQYAFLAAGLTLCLLLCLSCQREINVARTRAASQNSVHEESISKLQAELSELREQLKEVDHRAQSACVPAVPQRGMNLTKRTQVLRMHKRGERAEQISAALCLPPSEVELLLKLHLATVEPI
jgi:hypothetical protein